MSNITESLVTCVPDNKYTSKKLFAKRSWLNPSRSEDTGHAKSVVTIEHWEDNGNQHSDINAEFTLADCYRKVDIALDCATKKVAQQRLAKIDILLSHLHGIRHAIESNLKELK